MTTFARRSRLTNSGNSGGTVGGLSGSTDTPAVIYDIGAIRVNPVTFTGEGGVATESPYTMQDSLHPLASSVDRQESIQDP